MEQRITIVFIAFLAMVVAVVVGFPTRPQDPTGTALSESGGTAVGTTLRALQEPMDVQSARAALYRTFMRSNYSIFDLDTILSRANGTAFNFIPLATILYASVG